MNKYLPEKQLNAVSIQRNHIPFILQYLCGIICQAVTNALFWEEQDLSSTCARIFPKWLDWVDIYHPPTTNLQ